MTRRPYTIAELAEAATVARRTVERRIADGTLEVRRLAGTRRVVIDPDVGDRFVRGVARDRNAPQTDSHRHGG